MGFASVIALTVIAPLFVSQKILLVFSGVGLDDQC